MQMNEETLMSIVERVKEMKSQDLTPSLDCELEFFFDNVMDTVVEFFEVEKV